LLGGADDTLFAHAYTTRYQYDALGNLLCVEQHGTSTTGTGCAADPANDATSPWRVRRFTYDMLSRLTSSTNPESGTVNYEYDDFGDLLTKTSPAANEPLSSGAKTKANYKYDSIHRVTGITYTGVGYTETTPPVTYGYDVPCCGVPISNSRGRLAYATAGNTELVYQYDPMGRLQTLSDCPPSGMARGYCYGVGATYDFAGNQRSQIYPDGRIVAFNYNSANELNQVQFSSFNGTTFGYTYWSAADSNFLPTGVPGTVTLGNGDVETQRFNNRLQLSEKILSRFGWGTFADHVLNYGAQNNGNIMSVTDQLNAVRTQTYSYDQLNRLLTANESRWGMSYVYDAWGNYLQQNQTGGTTYQHQYLADVNNRLIGYTYDGSGNVLSDGVHQYAYDAENRIKTVDSTAATYTYNPEANRVRKDVGSSSNEYFYFGGRVIAELNPAEGWRDYIYANGQRVAEADTFFRETAIGGTNSTNTQSSTFRFTNAGALIGYVVRPSDKFYFWQYEWPSTEAGLRITFTDGTNTNWIAVDQNGDYMNQQMPAHTASTRIVDLSAFAGKQVSALHQVSEVGTAAGDWAASFHDIALVSADGSIISVYNGQAANPTVFDLSNGATGQYSRVNLAVGMTDTTNATTYYHDDQLGTSRVMMSHNGYPVWQGTFLPYGEEYNPQMTMNHFKFTGKERDSESGAPGNGLDYFGARYYSNALGRFMTPDWAANATAVPYARFDDPQTLNLYGYVRSSPLSLNDPDGHGWFNKLLNAVTFGHFAEGEELEKKLQVSADDARKRIAARHIPDDHGVLMDTEYLSHLPNTAVISLRNELASRDLDNAYGLATSFVSLLDAKARTHTLDGDATGGGHRAGTGIPGKSEFPSSWSDEKIEHTISDIATDPASKVTVQGRTKVIDGTREGVDVRVIERDGRIVGGYPTNLPRNP
jgi:RHS repeat-associated protein